MSESEEEEEEASYYGTPLDPYDEDAFPKKKPIPIEDQVAKDAQGRRRFHGAFTGGFSAGFFNTVGSLEGFTPNEFRSSRTEKAIGNVQRPEDYMDDEDLGEFGIAPQTVRATKEYNDSKKRKKTVCSDGPIPGTPVLETLIEAGNETVGYFLMKNMNRRHHQQQTGVKVYGCAMPSNVSEDDTPRDEYTLHECYTNHLKAPKTNTFGLGYVTLDKTRLNLFQPVKLTVRERNNKKLSITGQAFGVGAFEDDDEDIYVKDDMTRYDFELTSEASAKKRTSNETLLYDMFVISTKSTLFKNNVTFPPPIIPSTFTGRHKVKKSRFEPLAPDEPAPSLNAAVRAKYLGESQPEAYTRSKSPPKPAESQAPQAKVKNEVLDNILVDRFVSAKQNDDPTNILEPVQKYESDHGTEEMRAAVKMKMFGPLTRVILAWQPCALLCKKFNVPEPRFEELNAQKRKRTKNLIFEHQKHEEKEAKREPGLEIKPSPSTSSQNETPPDHSNETNIQETKTSDTPPETIDVTARLDVSQKVDLFKAVFLSSSSESDTSDKEDNEETKKKELIATNVLIEPLVPKIKPIKEGILSNLDFLKVAEKRAHISEESNTYGPRLPSSLLKVAPTVTQECATNMDEWVEKDEVGKDTKHKRKHKKKHKHKSKR